jgi:hypothetical protein
MPFACLVARFESINPLLQKTLRVGVGEASALAEASTLAEAVASRREEKPRRWRYGELKERD